MAIYSLNQFFPDNSESAVCEANQAVRQLLSVRIKFLLFRFKGFKHLFFTRFCPKIKLPDSLKR